MVQIANDTLARIFVVLFVLEVVGTLISFMVGVNSGIPTMGGFAYLTSSISGVGQNLGGSLNITILTPINTSSPSCTFLWVFNCNSNPVANAIMSLAGAGVYLINIAWKFFNLVFNLFAMVALVIIILLYLFFVLLPSLCIYTGVLGYIMGLGYAFIVLYLAWVFVNMILDMVKP